ncbi:MAG: glycine betaine ABC transporter substrate-binding protein, partial [Pseudomonadota bacterium]
MLNKPLTALACLVVGLPLALNPMMAEAVDTTEPVRISVIDSSDADMIAYSYGLLLREIGYNVEFIRIDYSAQIPALETQDIDVAPAIWDSTGWTSITDAVQAGVVVNFGSTGIRIREGWWYPSYVKEACPGLPDWSALQSEACAAIFATVETEPRGRFIDAPADWETDAQMRFDAFGMPLEAISSGSAVALVATMKAAVDQNEPVIGWGFTPHWFFDGVDGEYVELPAFEDACYDDAAWGVNTDAT